MGGNKKIVIACALLVCAWLLASLSPVEGDNKYSQALNAWATLSSFSFLIAIAIGILSFRVSLLALFSAPIISSVFGLPQSIHVFEIIHVGWIACLVHFFFHGILSAAKPRHNTLPDAEKAP